MPDLQGQLFGGAPGRKTYTEHGIPVNAFESHPTIKGGTLPQPQTEQLRMFMKPNEILSQYGPNDADRKLGGDYRQTRRSHTTQGQTNDQLYDFSPSMDDMVSQKTQGGSRVYGRLEGQDESDDELWTRKYAEANTNWGGSVHDPGGEIQQYPQSLAEHMRGGNVPGTVTLGTATAANGKRMISGGHHRLAVAKNDLPDAYLPVEHHEGSTYDARHTTLPGYRYT